MHAKSMHVCFLRFLGYSAADEEASSGEARSFCGDRYCVGACVACPPSVRRMHAVEIAGSGRTHCPPYLMGYPSVRLFKRPHRGLVFRRNSHYFCFVSSATLAPILHQPGSGGLRGAGPSPAVPCLCSCSREQGSALPTVANAQIKAYLLTKSEDPANSENTRASYVVFFFLPIIVSVACPTRPHPPLRLARRPNRGHIGGGGWFPSCSMHVCLPMYIWVHVLLCI